MGRGTRFITGGVVGCRSSSPFKRRGEFLIYRARPLLLRTTCPIKTPLCRAFALNVAPYRQVEYAFSLTRRQSIDWFQRYTLPTALRLHRGSRTLELRSDDAEGVFGLASVGRC
jgi:hypothetical protein